MPKTTQPEQTVTLTLDELKDISVKAMHEALARHDRDEIIARTLAEEEEMAHEIALAEAGKTRGRHSITAKLMMHRMQILRPAYPKFEFQREDSPARVQNIFAEAQRHLKVDLSAFVPAPRTRTVPPQDR